MPRLIDADALLDFIDVGHLRHPSELCFSEIEVANMLLHASTVSPDDVRVVGKWLRKEKVRHNLDGDGDYLYECSACGHSDEHNENVHVPFCWYCGAKMEVTQVEN